MFFTSDGLKFVLARIVGKYVDAKAVEILNVSGTLFSAGLANDITITGPKGFSEGTVIKIQSLRTNVNSLRPLGFSLDIQNGRLKMPLSEAIYFYGTYSAGALDINVYARQLNVREVLDIFAESSDLKDISGAISMLEAEIKGSFTSPKIRGSYIIDGLKRKDFLLNACQGVFELQVSRLNSGLSLFGRILISAGEVVIRNTHINLKQGSLFFDSDMKNPKFDLKGSSQIDSAKISVSLTGTAKNPEFVLTSVPPMPQDRLLFMLYTGRSWQISEDTFNKGQIPADLAKDFLDCMIFSNDPSPSFAGIGLKDISVKFDQSEKGLAVKKSGVSAGYSVEQSANKQGEPVSVSKTSGEYSITESISVGAERSVEYNSEKSNDTQNKDKIQPADKVLLKYKKAF